MKKSLPKQITDFLGDENKKIDFKNTFSEYVIFNTNSEVKKIIWNEIEAFDLLKEVENYDANGFLVWIPRFKCLGMIDFEHEQLSLLRESTFLNFLKKPDYYLGELVDGANEVELEDLLNEQASLFQPDNSIYGVLRRIQKHIISSLRFDFICEGTFLYEEQIGNSTFIIRYWHHKVESSRRVYASFNGWVPNCSYKANVGDFRYVFKENEFILPNVFYEKVDKLFRKVHKDYPFLFENSVKGNFGR